MQYDADGLTQRKALFVAEYRKDLNATKAAIRAGYSPKTANQAGARLLVDVKIRKVLARHTQESLDDAGVSADRVLKEIARLAFSDVRSLFDAQGNLKPLHTLTDHEAAAIASCEVIIKNAEAGDGHMDRVYKLKVWDKPKNLEMLAKHLGLLIERVQVKGDMTYGWKDTSE